MAYFKIRDVQGRVEVVSDSKESVRKRPAERAEGGRFDDGSPNPTGKPPARSPDQESGHDKGPGPRLRL
ncbi:hypothetical protein [Streptomyces sp. SID3343]|uniref:hypothetical protein n=1 Tax=Streptomyces sp. SID3343 TaxID=2690260 RepID=UPI00136F382B|nr:hypothetical protein [Streptomyces sp. SID3343]